MLKTYVDIHVLMWGYMRELCITVQSQSYHRYSIINRFGYCSSNQNDNIQIALIANN